MAPTPKLALYHFNMCPYCLRVRRAIGKLKLDVELRNIHEGTKHLKELTAATGRQTVPVLRITSADGTVDWMPESSDIIRYLQSLV